MSDKPKILIVEDDPASAEMLAELAGLGGYDADCAESVNDLLVAVMSGRYAAALLDLSLVGSLEDEVVDRLTGLGAWPPVVVFSARPVDDVRRAADRLGAVAWLQKPAGMAEILDALGRAVRSRSGSAT